MVRRRRLADAARGFRLAELESARSVVLEPRIGQGGAPTLSRDFAAPLCACAHTSTCHARRTTLYVPERCASAALTDNENVRVSPQTIFSISATLSFSFFSKLSLPFLSPDKVGAGGLPIRCSIVNYSSERTERLTAQSV